MWRRGAAMLFLLRNSCRVIAFARHQASSFARTQSHQLSSKTAEIVPITNPLLSDWSSSPYHLPPFQSIKPSDFQDAFEKAMKEHKEELASIAAETDPSFESIIVAYDRAGWLLERVEQVYSNLCSSANPPELQEVQTAMAPVISRHGSDCYRTPGLFENIQRVHQDMSILDPVQARLTDRIYTDFVRAGAALSEEQQERIADIKAELASLMTQFTQNVLADEEETYFVLSEQDMTGCPQSLIQAAKAAACERDQPDAYIVTLGRSLVEPFLTYSDRRDLRKKAFEAWTRRGELCPERDNASIAVSILQLRQELAKIHGFQTFANYQCADRMAQTPGQVMELLENVWGRAKVAAQKEMEEMNEFLKGNGEDLEGGIQAHDWRYYAEKVRKEKYDFDEAMLKPYMDLESVQKSMFEVSNKLFGLNYKRVEAETYHPDVELFEVRENDGSLRSIFLSDNFSRPHKSGGAWMSELRGQTKNLPETASPSERTPVICNNNNLAKGTSTTLLSPDDAKTLFHEFGHAHHGMLSESPYSRLAGTNVMTDFVELPSQLMEHWLLYAYKQARHVETGEPIPSELLEKLKRAESFQQGFATVEYTVCALMDMALHMQSDYDGFDLNTFEAQELKRLGMPEAIVMRHRPTHFQHLFSTSMYAAGYYVYQWAEVLEADAFALFEEKNDMFDTESAEAMRRLIYSSGNTRPPDELFREFRGRDPDINFMLRNKGMLVE